MSNMGFAGVANYAPVTSGTAVREMAVTGVAGSSIAVQGPSLGLNFLTAPIDGPALDPRITFTRATDATYIDSAGNLATGPNNLLRYSEEFNQASVWTLIAATISADATTAPDGTLTADKLVEDTALNTTHIVRQNFTTQNLQYTFSVYVKAAERNYALLFNGQSGSGQIFDLTTGQPVATGTTAPVAASGQLVGNGWCRLSITVNCTENVNDFRIYTALGPGSNTWVYTGDGVSGIYVWGAQLNSGATLQPYNKTTTAAYYGPRFDYNPTTLAPLGLLIEEARTNSIRNNTMKGTVAGTPGTLPTNWTAPALGTLSRTIVGTGTANGVEYIDVRFFGTTSLTSVTMGFDQNTQIPALNGQAWTASMYFSVIAGSAANITSIVNAVVGRNSSGTTLEYFPGVDRKGQTTFARASNTATFTNALTVFSQSLIVFTFASGVAIDITIRIGLPQLEQGAFATSVIRTTATALTRAADIAVMTGTNFSDWFNPVEGTFVANYDTVGFFGSLGSPGIISASDQSISNRIQLSHLNGPTRRAVVSTGSSVFDNQTTGQSVAGVPSKFAIAYKTDDFAACANGGTVGTDNLGALPTVNRFYIGQDYGAFNSLNGHVRSVAYYPRRLANAELQALTV